MGDSLVKYAPNWLLSVFGIGSISMGLYYWFFGGKKSGSKKVIHVPHNLDLKNQSVLLPGPERIRASKWGCPGNDPNQFLTLIDPKCRTAYDIFKRGLESSGNGPCIGTRGAGGQREYIWKSYQQILDRAHNIGAGLVNIGAKTGNDTLVGIYSANREEYDVAQLGIIAYSRVVVPLYDTLGPEAVCYILNQGQIQYIICDIRKRATQLLEPVRQGKIPNVKHIVMMDTSEIQQMTEDFQDTDVQIHSFDDVQRLGAREPVDLVLPEPQDVCIICYTSGTTGNPKGVMLTHKNIIAEASSVECFVANHTGVDFSPNSGADCLSYLPMAHMFEQCVHAVIFSLGLKIGYSSGDMKKLPDDLKTLRPILLPVVPRLLSRVYDVLKGRLDSGGAMSRMIYNIAFNSKLSQQKKGVYRSDTIWDKLIFGKVRNQMGGAVDIMVTGSAPISEEVLNTCRVALGCQIIEGYGQTECSAGCSLTLPGDFTAEHVGAPMPSCHLKLVDVPDLNYFAKDDKGEICIRGPIVMKGYFKEPTKTAEAIDSDGWLHTGDVGRWLPNGSLKIIDRKKHIFKLAQGEYVAPEKIESVYSQLPVVAQIYVDGDSLERFLVAIVVPEESELRQLAVSNSVQESSKSLEELCRNKTLEAAVLERLRAIGKENKLNSIEQVQAVYLCPELFSVENGLMTPTFKSKRPQLRNRFAEEMKEMYRSKK